MDTFELAGLIRVSVSDSLTSCLWSNATPPVSLESSPSVRVIAMRCVADGYLVAIIVETHEVFSGLAWDMNHWIHGIHVPSPCDLS